MLRLTREAIDKCTTGTLNKGILRSPLFPRLCRGHLAFQVSIFLLQSKKLLLGMEQHVMETSNLIQGGVNLGTRLFINFRVDGKTH